MVDRYTVDARQDESRKRERPEKTVSDILTSPLSQSDPTGLRVLTRFAPGDGAAPF